MTRRAEHLEAVFPGLRDGTYEVTSPFDAQYNCLAWAIGDDERWWWPATLAQRVGGYPAWPDNLDGTNSLDVIVEFLGRFGFEKCESPALDPALEKVAIYGTSEDSVAHFSRQLSDGSWTSKLGRGEDISHFELGALESDVYGEVVSIVCRPRQD